MLVEFYWNMRVMCFFVKTRDWRVLIILELSTCFVDQLSNEYILNSVFSCRCKGTGGLGMIIDLQFALDQLHFPLHVLRETTGGHQVQERMVGPSLMRGSMRPAGQGVLGVRVVVLLGLDHDYTGTFFLHILSMIKLRRPFPLWWLFIWFIHV